MQKIRAIELIYEDMKVPLGNDLIYDKIPNFESVICHIRHDFCDLKLVCGT